MGGGFAGAEEAIGEVEDIARDASKYYTNVPREDMRFILVDAADKILPEVGPKLASTGKEHLEGRGVEMFLFPSMDSCVDGHVVLEERPRGRLQHHRVKTSASKRTQYPLRVPTRPAWSRSRTSRPPLQVQGTDYIWATSDNAQVPDIAARKAGVENAWCPPNAQHALRQAKVLGDNVVSGMRGFPQKEYSHSNKGAVAGLGLTRASR